MQEPTRQQPPLSREMRRGDIYRDVSEKRLAEQQAFSQAELERAWIEEGRLHFICRKGQDRAFRDGVFLLAIPQGLNLEAVDLFANQFYRGDTVQPYGHFRNLTPDRFNDPLLGYHARINQIEQFLLERRYWGACYPSEITIIGEELTRISRQILGSVLEYSHVPPEHWPVATGGCSEGKGSYHLTFNHYRPHEQGLGLNAHKDDGFVTILRVTSEGLEINRRNEWEKVPYHPGYFVINFGLSMEILTAQSLAPVATILHRVAHQAHDRTSFGHFASSCCDPGSENGIYRYSPKSGLTQICTSRELIDNNDYEIYYGMLASEESQ